MVIYLVVFKSVANWFISKKPFLPAKVEFFTLSPLEDIKPVFNTVKSISHYILTSCSVALYFFYLKGCHNK